MLIRRRPFHTSKEIPSNGTDIWEFSQTHAHILLPGYLPEILLRQHRPNVTMGI